MKKTGKSTMVKRASMIFIFCIACSVLTGVNAFAQHYLSHGVRDSLTHKEKIALAHDESRHLSWHEVNNRVKYLEKIPQYINPDKAACDKIRGHHT